MGTYYRGLEFANFLFLILLSFEVESNARGMQ